MTYRLVPLAAYIAASLLIALPIMSTANPVGTSPQEQMSSRPVRGQNSANRSAAVAAYAGFAKRVASAPRAVTQVGQQTTNSQSDEASQGKQQRQQRKKPQTKNPQTLQTILVTGARGSRIDFKNVIAVTPNVTFTPQSLSLPTYNNVGDALYALPYFSADRGPSATGTNTDAGSSPIDLRGLGVKRTLLLVDGHRIAGLNDAGSVDLNAIPSILVKSVDIVTGGASAAWGSGAVAGVVAVTMNHNFNGFELNAGYGESSHEDDNTRIVRFAAGTDFSAGKGHIEIGGDFVDSDGVLRRNRPRTARWALVPVHGTDQLLEVGNVGQANETLGGLIRSGVFKGMAFDPDGTLHRHTLVQTFGTLGVGDSAPSSDDYSYVVDPVRHSTVLASMHYNFADNLLLTATFRHFESSSNYTWFSVGFDDLTFNVDNPYLPKSIADTMRAAGETSFTMGRFRRDINYPHLTYINEANQGTISLQGTMGYWHWTAFASHGLSFMRQYSPGFFIQKNLDQALDAVADPVTGQPVCRVALTDPTSDCVPINMFGFGSPSAKAQAYVTGTPREHVKRKLDQAAFTITGQPWELPAGLVSVAAGLDGRYINIDQNVGALDAAKAYRIFFYNPEHGSQSVHGAFAEINVPLLSDKTGFQHTAINAAVRESNYNTSGRVWTWKVGLTNEFFDGFRGRVAYSRDIRAPSLNELYLEGTQGFNTIFDPVLDQSYLVLDNAGGNTDLQPEKAKTLTVGVSWAPPSGSLSGLLLSADYYDININDIITTIGTQQTINRCQSGNQSICARIIRGPDKKIERVSSQFINLSQFKEDGVDLEAGYAWHGSLFGTSGSFRVRTVATWVHQLTTFDGISTINFVGTTGVSFTGKAIPRWKALTNFSFTSDRFALNARVRYLSAGAHETNQDIINNRIAQYFYFGLGGSYAIPNTPVKVYVQVRNLFDKRPPIASGFSPFYDVVGRFVMAGVRVRLH